MKPLILLFIPFIYNSLFAQSPIDVTDQTVRIGGARTEELLFGFAAGDQILFNFSEAGGKELKEVEISEWPSTSKFSDFKTSGVQNKMITVNREAIYRFRFFNSALTGRVCKIKIQRIPATENSRSFNSGVEWKTVSDTSYTNVSEQYLVKSEYKPVVVVPLSDFYINSGSNATMLGGKSRISVPVQLPRGTVEWWYQFSAHRDPAAMAKTKSGLNLLGDLTKLIDQTGGLNFAMDLLTKPPGADYCDIYLMDGANSPLFIAKQVYRYFPTGSRENMKSGIIKMPLKGGGLYYIGIKNPDGSHGINVVIECVAIVLHEEWATREIKKPVITSRQIPVLQN